MISIDEYLIPCTVAGLVITACYLVFSIILEHLSFCYVKSEYMHKLYNIIFTVIFMWVSINIAGEIIKYVLL